MISLLHLPSISYFHLSYLLQVAQLPFHEPRLTPASLLGAQPWRLRHGDVVLFVVRGNNGAAPGAGGAVGGGGGGMKALFFNAATASSAASGEGGGESAGGGRPLAMKIYSPQEQEALENEMLEQAIRASMQQ